MCRSRLLMCLLLIVFIPAVVFAGFKEKKEQKLADSAEIKNVSGGVTFQSQVAINSAYDIVLNHLKRQGLTIDSADKEVGQIVTAMDITGGYSQTGKRVYVTFIKDNDTQTTLRVAVSEQKRKKLLSVEPWGNPKVNNEQSAKIADEIKSLFTGSATTANVQ